MLAGFVTIAVGWNSGRMNERTWHITISKIVAIAGFIICVSTLNTWARYFGVIVLTWGARMMLSRRNKRLLNTNPDATNFYMY